MTDPKTAYTYDWNSGAYQPAPPKPTGPLTEIERQLLLGWAEYWESHFASGLNNQAYASELVVRNVRRLLEHGR